MVSVQHSNNCVVGEHLEPLIRFGGTVVLCSCAEDRLALICFVREFVCVCVCTSATAGDCVCESEIVSCLTESHAQQLLTGAPSQRTPPRPDYLLGSRPIVAGTD